MKTAAVSPPEERQLFFSTTRQDVKTAVGQAFQPDSEPGNVRQENLTYLIFCEWWFFCGKVLRGTEFISFEICPGGLAFSLKLFYKEKR